MSYIITTKQQHHQVPEGQEANRKERHGKVMYEFESDSDECDFVAFSFDYIKNRKQIFDIKQSE